MFYLLRFVLEKFYPTDSSNYHQVVLNLLENKSEPLIPFCDYLLKRISENRFKKVIVEELLLRTISDHPQQCVWTIAFLGSFPGQSPSKKGPVTPAKEEAEREIMFQLFRRFEKQGKISPNISLQMKWIKMLADCASFPPKDRMSACSKVKAEKVPQDLPFVFMPSFNIERLTVAKNLSNGKSAPLELDFSLSQRGGGGKNFKFAKIIIKVINGKEKYLLERDTANFFASSGLIDREATYHIHMMSRYLVAIEYVENIGTVNSIIEQ